MSHAIFQLRRMCASPMGGRPQFGGDSSSSQTTNNTDARVVGGENSQNASVVGNSGPVSITSTDHGAVAGSLQLALKGVEGAQATARETIAATGGLLDGALRMVGEQQQQHSQALENIKGSDVRTLVIAGMAVVGVVGLGLLQRKG